MLAPNGQKLKANGDKRCVRTPWRAATIIGLQQSPVINASIKSAKWGDKFRTPDSTLNWSISYSIEIWWRTYLCVIGRKLAAWPRDNWLRPLCA